MNSILQHILLSPLWKSKWPHSLIDAPAPHIFTNQRECNTVWGGKFIPLWLASARLKSPTSYSCHSRHSDEESDRPHFSDRRVNDGLTWPHAQQILMSSTKADMADMVSTGFDPIPFMLLTIMGCNLSCLVQSLQPRSIRSLASALRDDKFWENRGQAPLYKRNPSKPETIRSSHQADWSTIILKSSAVLLGTVLRLRGTDSTVTSYLQSSFFWHLL